MHLVIQLSKPMEDTMPGVNSNVKYELWVTMTSTVGWLAVANVLLCAGCRQWGESWVLGRRIGKLCTPVHVFCESKTTLKS